MSSDSGRLSDIASSSTAGDPAVSSWVYMLSVRAVRALEYSSVYLALIAAAKVLIVIHLLSLEMSLAPLIGALVTFAVYANDRLVDTESDAVSNPRRTAFVRRYRSELYVGGALAYGIGVALSALGGPRAFLLTLFPGVVWVVYAVDWLYLDTTQFTRLKEIPIVNSTLVALAWALPVILLPLSFSKAPITPAVGILFVYFLLMTFINTEISNIRDLESDTDSGILTMPTVLGVVRTRAVLYGTTLLTVSVLGYGQLNGHLSGQGALALSAGIVALVAVLALMNRIENKRVLSIAAECTQLPVLAMLGAFAVL